jgi:hypothetical protein
MNDDRLGGIALIAGAVAGLVTMSLHPTGHDLAAPGQFAAAAFRNAAAHALAIASLPVSFLGALALSRRLESPARLATAALVVYGFALAAVMSAAVVSGFAAPHLVKGMTDAVGPARDGWEMLLDYNYFLNQAFARVYVVASFAAIFLWSLAIVRSRALAAGVGVYGLAISPVAILAVVSGHVRLGVHGFGVIMLVQALWLIAAGVGLLRFRAP